VADGTRDADADVIVSGRDPGRRALRPGGPGWLLAGALAVALGVAGTVVITAAALPGADRAQFTVSAVITGGTPGTVYDLIGSDCSAADRLADEVWATGLAGADGTADLTGYAWTGSVADRYWMTLDPSSGSSPPGLRGQFAAGRATPFPAGQAPCAVSP
jgi:hypothetical protein